MSQQSQLTTQPQNISLAQSTQYTLIFPQLPFLKYFLASAILPSVSNTPAPQGNPHAQIWRHSDHLNYDPINLTALCDEDLKTWQETYEWMKGLTTPTAYSEYIKNKHMINTDFPLKTLYVDGIMTINTNANNPLMQIKFANCHPTYLGMLMYNNADDAKNTLTFDLTFQYDYFEIQRL